MRLLPMVREVRGEGLHSFLISTLTFPDRSHKIPQQYCLATFSCEGLRTSWKGFWVLAVYSTRTSEPHIQFTLSLWSLLGIRVPTVRLALMEFDWAVTGQKRQEKKATSDVVGFGQSEEANGCHWQQPPGLSPAWVVASRSCFLGSQCLQCFMLLWTIPGP